MVGIVGNLSEASRSFIDIDRVSREVDGIAPPVLTLFKVVSSAPIAGTDKRFIYNMTKASVRKENPPGTDVYDIQNSPTGSRFKGISLSELSNAGSAYSYGVVKANVPSGFEAVRIPNGTAVAAFPIPRFDGGGTIWIIINTQAIDGICAVPLTDGGIYYGES